MPVAGTYGKSEDAHVAASLLRSEGIEATVFEDSAFGGNLLGMSAGAIRVEVPEEMLERARSMLVEADSHREVGTGDLVEAGPSSRLPAVFRKLVLADFVLNVLCWFSQGALFLEAPSGTANGLEAFVRPEALWAVAFLAGQAGLVLEICAFVLLLCFIRMGRVLFIGALICVVVASVASPPYLLTPLGNVLGAIHWLFSGIIVGLMFVPELSVRFKSPVGDPSP